MPICTPQGQELKVEYSLAISTAYGSVADWTEISGAVGTLDVNGGDKSAGMFMTHGGPIGFVTEKPRYPECCTERGF